MSYRRVIGLGTAAALVAALLGTLLLSGGLTSQAVQDPSLSLDMDPAGNTYTPSVDADFDGIPESGNAMTVGTIENCFTSMPGNNAEHSHPVHLIIQDVEDLVGWQARINFDGTKAAPANPNFQPFTDTAFNQSISFVNLPVDTVAGGHHSIFGTSDIQNPTAANGTALIAAAALGESTFALSPDVPEKSPHDETVRTYTISGGGVLASLDFVTRAGQDGQPSLQLDMDDASPHTPGSKVNIFDSTGVQSIEIGASALGDGFHGEGATCEALPEPPTPTPSPTPEPTPTPGPPTPTPPPLQQGPARFNPQVSESYSDTAPGSHPDVTRTLNIGLGPDGRQNTYDDTGDYDFAGIVSFSPSSPRDAEIPDTAITGNLDALLMLGLVNSGCTTVIPARFTFMEATTDITNTVEPLPYGLYNELSPLAGDRDQDGNPEVKPPPAVTNYPSYLNAIFDPDWVDFGPDRIAGNADDTNGPQPPIQPIARFAAVTVIPSAGNLWMVLQELVFEPGTKLPRLPAFDSALGYPSLTVVQQSSAAGSAAPVPNSAISDFCTPFDFNIQSYGVTRDNPDTPGDEGGVNVRTLPQAGTTLTTSFFAFSQRDADGDGFENGLDPCPFHADILWDPRVNPPPDDNDEFGGTVVADGLPNTCDPTPTRATGDPPANSPVDHDGDGFLNRGDNCPVHRNPDQADRDMNDAGEIVGDGIGDVCDTPGTDAGADSAGRPIPGPRTVAGKGPSVPDGDEIACVRTLTTTVGGPNEAQVSGCDSALSPGGGGGGTPAGTFNPQSTVSFASTAPGASSDITTTLDIGLGPDGLPNTPDDPGDYNIADVVSFTPSQIGVPTDVDIPDGARVGTVNWRATLGSLAACSVSVSLNFPLFDAATDTSNTVSGSPAFLAGDLNRDTVVDIKPAPVVTQYPSFLNTLFGNVKPRARYAGAAVIPPARNFWVILQLVVFEPGTKLPGFDFYPGLGYPAVTVFQDPTSSPSASLITDFCTPLTTTTTLFGSTLDNPDTPGGEGGLPFRTNPSSPGPINFTVFAASGRDADGDGFENNIDTCPFHADTVWDPRVPSSPGDSDVFAGVPIGDGIPETCDPTPTEATAGSPVNQPTDHDGDGFPNRGDNCPVHNNPDQSDSDFKEFGVLAPDGIGDACDTPGTAAGTDSAGRPVSDPRTVAGNGPNVPDGPGLVCVRNIAIEIGGPNQGTTGECLEGLPPSPPAGCIRDDNDFDDDGVGNRRDRDDDNDGTRDGKDRDDDNDGVRDRWDPDDDNDGITDREDEDDGALFCPDDEDDDDDRENDD